VRLFTRRGFDWTERYPRVSAAVGALWPASVTIDGEVVCCDDAGVAVFQKLHSRAHDGEAFLYAFDLLELDGEDWRPPISSCSPGKMTFTSAHHLIVDPQLSVLLGDETRVALSALSRGEAGRFCHSSSPVFI
jgi:ATP dependent DNA ligase domain